MTWSEEKTEQLKALLAEDPRPTRSKMAQLLGVTRNAVIGKIDRIEHPRRTRRPRTRLQAKRPEKGMPPAEWRE